jgi:hypothetical protein
LLALVLLASAVLLVGLLAYPYRLALNGELRGEPDGSWAGAGGLGLGVLSVTLAAARGVPAYAQFELFGIRLFSRPLARGAKPEKEPKPRRPARFGRFVDPYEIAVSARNAARRFGRPALVFEARYSFRDVVLTGRISGALYVLEAILPEGIEIRQDPSFEIEDRFALALAGTIRISPLLLLYEGLCYMWRMRRKSQRATNAASALLPRESGGRP